MKELEQNYARTFSTSAGTVVLRHLRKITVERVLGPDASDAQLRGLEAQRALVHQIENMIERGK
ncbi:MAG: hypothetical protein IAC69_04255 [Proteobacteria bacterium]|uniref:Bbp19-like phage domain-containing protein n=1 Tax=Candidatus Enterousia avistercoris TaxID=2840788 RepID=A0A9D9GSK3_9PROT|nr:hypothetical protein [Candidatus Enterousia avistercoris]